jgi:hypothetical protein
VAAQSNSDWLVRRQPKPCDRGNSLTLTASEISGPKRAVAEVAFYVQIKYLEHIGTNPPIWTLHWSLLGCGRRTSPGAWTSQMTASLAPGPHTLLARTRNRLADLGPPKEIELLVR